MRRRPLAVAVLLACAAVVVFVLVPGRPGSGGRGRDARDDPALGAPPPSLAIRPALSDGSRPVLADAGAGVPGEDRLLEAIAAEASPLHGHVRDERGVPIEGAMVYLLDKATGATVVPGEVRPAISDGTGAWTLARVVPKGRWIGARAPGRPPAPADGAAIDPRGEVEIVLRDGPLVRVTVEDEAGRPVEVRVWVASETGADWWPAPGAAAGASAKADTDAEGNASFRVGTLGPVGITVQHEPHSGWCSDPPEVRLRGPGGRARFTMRPSCTVDVRAVDAATREAVTNFSVELLDAAGERKQSFGVSLSTEEGSSFEMSGGIGPGEYRVALEAVGYRRWESEPFAFARFGESKAVVASLERDTSTGILSFLLSAADGELPAVGSAPVIVLVREREREDARWALPLGGGTLAEAGPRGPVVSCRCPSGTYDAIAWLGEPRRAGVAERFSVRAGLENEVRVVLRPGIDVAVSALVPVGESAKEIRIDAVGEGAPPATQRLPLVWIHGGGTVSWGQSGGAFNAPAVLGPYPFARVRATVTLASGERRETLLPPP